MNGTDPVRQGRQWLLRLQQGRDLSGREAYQLAEGLTSGAFPEALAGALLSTLAGKGETPEEILAFAMFLRRHARRFPRDGARPAVDLCGTGGSAHPTYNVSTVSAFVVASGGLPVIKHGNASARGPCGSSDLLEALGLPVKATPAYAEETFRRERIAFLHAPLYHPATASVAGVRRALGVRTVFNLLGPLTNPASVEVQVTGCFDLGYARTASELLLRLGVSHSLTFTGQAGADEFVPGGRTLGFSSRAGRRASHRFQGTTYLTRAERKGRLDPMPPAAAAQEAERLLNGAPGARRGSVLLTSGAAFWVAGWDRTLKEGVERARELLEEGRALAKLRALQQLAAGRTWT
jgi:anthranilate phosphoribosyltransferase